MALLFNKIEWDHGNRDKCEKHGVSIDEIEYALREQPYVVEDPVHSANEQRFRAIGQSRTGRRIFIVLTVRPRGVQFLARPISAGYMHSKEVRSYEPDKA